MMKKLQYSSGGPATPGSHQKYRKLTFRSIMPGTVTSQHIRHATDNTDVEPFQKHLTLLKV